MVVRTLRAALVVGILLLVLIAPASDTGRAGTSGASALVMTDPPGARFDDSVLGRESASPVVSVICLGLALVAVALTAGSIIRRRVGVLGTEACSLPVGVARECIGPDDSAARGRETLVGRTVVRW